MNKLLLLLVLSVFYISVQGQFFSEQGDTLYGNEWIDYDQEYHKISIAEDGIYRITGEELSNAGIDISNIKGENFQLFHNGKAYPLFITTKSNLNSDDFIEFYGKKNRGELDAIFYEDPESMHLNPEYSLFTDTSAYFLTWNDEGDNVRVNEVNTNLEGNPLPPEKFYMHRERMVLNSRIHKPTRNGADNVRYSHFDVGEGFGGALATKNEVTLAADNVYSDGPDPNVNIRFTTNSTAHIIKFFVNDIELDVFNHTGYRLRQEKVTFPLSEIKNSNKIKLEGTVDNFDRNVISVVDLNYPRSFNFNNDTYAEIFVEESPFEKYIELEEVAGTEIVIYDPASASRIIPEIEDGKVKFLLPGANMDRNILVYNVSEEVRSISGIMPVEFINYGDIDKDYVIISSSKLRNGISDQVQAYADYRQSAAGGSFDPVIVDVKQLYNQFSYGVSRHSYSIKNFANFIKKKWSNPEYIFIIGKGREYGVYRKASQIDDPLNEDFTVPTFGMPGSDNLLVSTGNISAAHTIPTGRISTKDSDEVADYLEKVKEHEAFESKPLTIEDRLWKKRIMHLVGAQTELQESIGSFLENMEVIIENNQFGANVTTFRKSSTETIQEADADAILESVDKGLSVLTFFGHSSVGTFDFNIDDVKKLNNKGKYPLVISLGCFSGNVHTSSYGISEQYVITPERGAIAFIASSSTAYVQPQGAFGLNYYSKLGDDYYGKSLGEILAATVKDIDQFTGIHTKILSEQITLHGDPAIKLHKAEGPDYVFDFSSFNTDPAIIESNEDEFELSFKIANLGKYESRQLNVKLEHLKSNGDSNAVLDFDIHAPKYDTLITVTIENDDFTNVGKNLIKGELDKGKLIPELPDPDAENNNKIIDGNGDEGYAFYSINNSAEPVSPCDFAIYNQQKVILRASTYNGLSGIESKYVIEIDTTEIFDSPLKQRTEIISLGGLMEWEPSLNFEQGTSYYWRVSPDSINADIGYTWSNSSFVYLPNSSHGWNQSHYYQFLDNEYDGISLEEDRAFKFDTSGFFIKIFNSIWDPNTTGYQFNFESYAASVRPWNYMSEGIAIVVADSKTGSAWVNGGGEFGSINTSNFGSFRSFGFPTNSTENRAKIINMLENEIPDSNFVFFFTVLRNFDSDFVPKDWESDKEFLGNDIFSVLESEGAILARQLEETGSVPYTFIYQKGVKVLSEEIGVDKQDYITSTAFIPIKRLSGEVSSELVGPAKKWEKIILNIEEDNTQDTTILSIFGVDFDGNAQFIKSSSYESEIDISEINPTQFPFIKLKIESKDERNVTPSQLNFWRVFYEGYPDINLNTSEVFEFNRDTLQQGEELSLRLELENISEYPLDSISLEIEISDNQNNAISFLERIKPLQGFEETVFEFQYNTRELYGNYQLTINVNGDRSEIEKLYFNNFGVREFVVIKDIKNPILDVSFDGEKIMDGDIVSPTPIISISVKDENEYLLLDDPSIAKITLIHPDNNEEEVQIIDERIKFFPASSTTDNLASFEFTPDFTIDGTYILRISASDISKNASGDVDFERSFEIINEQQISNILNYPNPFSTSTEFIFTLTGREIPDEIKIQILTVSGKIVKEIFKEELGPLKIGINRTEYKWDGTDDYGNRLANGVYLYRVVVKDQNQFVNRYEIEETNSYFKNNLGKMVILR